MIVPFRCKRADRIKVLWWDGTGLVVAHKRLEQGRFSWPAVQDGVMRLSPCGPGTLAASASKASPRRRRRRISPRVRFQPRARSLMGRCRSSPTTYPLYRQSQILARSGIELHRSILAGWVGKASFHLRPVYDRLTRELKTSDKPGLDETTVRVLDPGRGKTKTGYMWTMVRDERARRGADPPGCVYAYAQP